MAGKPDLDAAISSWEARNWKDLRATWERLAKGPTGELVRFRDSTLAPQAAGRWFQRWIIEAFRLSHVEAEHAFENPQGRSERTLEEVDGVLYEQWQGFLVESKYQGDRLDIDPIFRLHQMVEQRPIGTLGLLVSFSGYTPSALELVERLRPIRVLLFEKVDLDWAMEGRPGGMMEMVRRKWMLAIKSGRPNVPVKQFQPRPRGA